MQTSFTSFTVLNPSPSNLKSRTVKSKKEAEAIAIVARGVEVYSEMSTDQWPLLLEELEITSEELDRIRTQQRRAVEAVFFEPTNPGEKRKFPDEFKRACAYLSSGKRAAEVNRILTSVFSIVRGQVRVWAEEHDIVLPLLRAPNGAAKANAAVLSTKNGVELSEAYQQDLAIILHGIEATFNDAQVRIRELLQTLDIHGQTAAAIKRRYPNTEIEYNDNAKDLKRKRYPPEFKAAVSRVISTQEASIVTPAIRHAIGTSRTQLVQWGIQVGIEIPKLRESAVPSPGGANPVTDSSSETVTQEQLQALVTDLHAKAARVNITVESDSNDVVQQLDQLCTALMQQQEASFAENASLQQQVLELTDQNNKQLATINNTHAQNIQLTERIAELDRTVTQQANDLQQATAEPKQSTDQLQPKEILGISQYIAGSTVIDDELQAIADEDLPYELMGILESLKDLESFAQDEAMQGVINSLLVVLETTQQDAQRTANTMETWMEQITALKELTTLASKSSVHQHIAVLLAACTNIVQERFVAWQQQQSTVELKDTTANNNVRTESNIQPEATTPALLMGVSVQPLSSNNGASNSGDIIAAEPLSKPAVPTLATVRKTTPEPKPRYAKTLAEERELSAREIERRDLFMDCAMHLSIARTNYCEVVSRVLSKVGEAIIKRVIKDSEYTFTAPQRATLVDIGLPTLRSVFERIPVSSGKTNITQEAEAWFAIEFQPTLEAMHRGELATKEIANDSLSETERRKKLNSTLFRMRFYDSDLNAKIRAAVAKNDRLIKYIAIQFTTKAGDSTYLPFEIIYDEARRLAEIVIEQWDTHGNFKEYLEQNLFVKVEEAAAELVQPARY